MHAPQARSWTRVALIIAAVYWIAGLAFAALSGAAGPGPGRVAWPLLTGVPAFLVALVAALVLRRSRPGSAVRS